jgi:hypothetical protein
MKSLLILTLCLGMLFWAGATTAGYAPILDFEDLYPGYPAEGPMPGPSGQPHIYQGFSWVYTARWVTPNCPGYYQYNSGIIGNVGLHNMDWDLIHFYLAIPGTFDFLGAYFTGAQTDWDLTVEGGGGTASYSTTITILKDTPQWFDLNFTDVTWITITPHPVGNPSITGGDFVMDNVNAPLGGDGDVPICSTLLLLGSGLLGLLALRHRRVAHA